MQESSIGAVSRLVVPLLSLLLGACLLMPGKFTSQLDIRRGGAFTFTYTGEIHAMALSKLANAGKSSPQPFSATPCFNEDGSEERACSDAEIASQKEEWQRQQDESTARRKRDADQAKAMMGGIDPSDPRSAEELAERLRRQAGWRKVEYKGDGLFLVDFALSGRLDHDFTFPTIERFPLGNSFVQIALRQDGTVRIDAPGFGPAGTSPLQAMMMGIAASDGGKDDALQIPQVDGSFMLRTDAEILANNTDEGPQPDPSGKRLAWTVTPRSTAPPTALLRLAK